MASLFCRHNRLTVNCPICSRELESELKAKAPPRPARARAASSATRTRRSSASTPRSGGVVTRRVARAADDGYRNQLAPGLRATADAERLAAALTQAAARLEPPGPYPEIATEPDIEEGTWLAFLLALAGPDRPELQDVLREAHPPWAAAPADLPAEMLRTAEAYRAWAGRAGSQQRAFEGDAAWTPERRFARVFERLALPGFGRGRRYDLLTALGAAGLYELRAGELHITADEDPTTVAAKRLLVSGDRLLLERRARDLADACELPVAALDRALVVWNAPAAQVDTDVELPDAVRRALGLT
jgi:hypothetical protein